MRKRKITEFVPPGLNGAAELGWIIAGIAASALFSLVYVYRYIRVYTEAAAEYEIAAKYGYEIIYYFPAFRQLLGGCLSGFIIMIVIMALLCLFHRYMHFNGSGSIYTLRRLPQKGELFKYTCGLPLFGAILGFCLGLLIFFIYLAVYFFITPAAWLV